MNTSLYSLPLYMVSFLEAPNGGAEKHEFKRSKMLWHDFKGKNKCHLVNSPIVCMPKDCDSLGILDLLNYESMPSDEMDVEV